jgi:hypothetical protein
MSAISQYSNYSQFKNVDSKVNAMIKFDQSGTPGQIIGSAGTAGLTWVDSDPSSASFWSEYPATQNVDISDHNIDNVNTIELVNIIDSSGSSGTDTQLLSQDAVGAKWIDQNAVISKWSEFPATQTIDASGNDISDVGTLYVNTLIKNDTNKVNLDMVDNKLRFANGSQNSEFSYNTIVVRNNANSDSVRIQNNNMGVINDINNTGMAIYSTLMRMSDPTYWNTTNTSSIVINKLASSEQSQLTSQTLTLTDVSSNSSILSSTDLTFNGIPYSRNMINSSLVYSSAAIYADSTYPPATNLLIRNTYGYSGWAFINTALGSKFNYYFAPQSPTTRVVDIKGITFNYFNATQTSNDYQIFCTIYTKPQPGDITFYHSKRNYIFNQSLTPTINTSYQACVLVDKSLVSYYYETQINYQLDPLNQVGPFLPTEEILAITLASDSACPAGTMSVVLSKLNIIMDKFTKEFQLVSP